MALDAKPSDVGEACDQVRAWPEAGLEAVPACPVCGSANSEVLYKGLTDRVFGCAAGSWTIKTCHGCQSAFLDPRPTPETLGQAYAKYYTHAAEETSQSWLTRLARSAANGLRQRKFGSSEQPTWLLGGRLLALVPWLPLIFDGQMRHLPKAPRRGNRLLDVGCGNGRFLTRAKAAGWQVRGIDIDAAAVSFARTQGLDVTLEGIERVVASGEKFDVVTSSHVIEHVYDPGAMIQGMHDVLNPGGRLWIETPNLESFGHARFGASWRDLDVPRHLVLFNRDALINLLRRAGFEDIRIERRAGATFNTLPASQALAEGAGKAIETRASGLTKLRAALTDMWACYLAPRRTEFLTITARRSS